MGSDCVVGRGLVSGDFEAVISVVDKIIFGSAGGWTGGADDDGGGTGIVGDGGASVSFGFARDFRGFGGAGSFGVADAFFASFASLAFASLSSSTCLCSAEIVI